MLETTKNDRDREGIQDPEKESAKADLERSAVTLSIYETDRRGRWKERWLWLSGTGIKMETESLIMAAQEQAIRTNVIKARIDRTQEESRMCGRANEMGKNTLGRVQENYDSG